MPATSDVENKIAIELLKKDVTTMTVLLEKFDTTIEKMQEIAINLSKMVSLQEQRLESQEAATKEVQSIIEMRRIEHNNDIKEINARISSVNKELSEKIEETERLILSELKQIREEIKGSNAGSTSLSDRIASIEAWKYMVGGALLVITYILGETDMLNNFFKLVN